MPGVKVIEFYVQYMFSNGQQCDMVQKKIMQPATFTEVKNLDEFKGDGWRLLSEDDLKKSNNPFEELKTMFGEE